MAWYCSWCDVSFSEAFSHRTLGPVCGRCMRPVVRRPRRGRNMRGKLEKIAARDRWQCQLCWGYVDPQGVGVAAPSLDHKVPVSAGGRDAMRNLQLAHAGCNAERGSMPLDAWLELHPRPVTSSGAPITDVSLGHAARQKLQAGHPSGAE